MRSRTFGHTVERPSSRILVLNPVERYSEIVCGLIMVLSFTAALCTSGGEEDVHRECHFSASAGIQLDA
jgi:hypothetical protein